VRIASRLRRGLRRRLRRVPRTPHRVDYVFVVTYGRSGSTLLQGLLNALPRVVVRGENGLFVLQLYRAWAQARAVRERHRKHRPRKVQSAFYGIHRLRRRQFTVATRGLMTEFLLGSLDRSDVDVIGFKEVLWHEVKPKETERFFDFMDAAFPGARYVLNQRDHAKVAVSGFWQRKDDDDIFRALQRVEEIQDYLRESRPDRVLDTRYERFTSEDRETSDAQLRAIAQFVTGSCDDVLLERMRETLGTGFGPGAFGNTRPRGISADAADDEDR
jgi:hypothetical protein